MLDRDLAELYGVTTGALNQAVKSNKNRFPERFMFQLTKEESENLKSQIVISSSNGESASAPILKSQSVISSWGGARSYPYAFTEQGIAMLSSVLRSETAALVSIRIMDVFVAMRKALASFSPMLMRLDMVERRQIIDQARNEERFNSTSPTFLTYWRRCDHQPFLSPDSQHPQFPCHLPVTTTTILICRRTVYLLILPHQVKRREFRKETWRVVNRNHLVEASSI